MIIILTNKESAPHNIVKAINLVENTGLFKLKGFSINNFRIVNFNEAVNSLNNIQIILVDQDEFTKPAFAKLLDIIIDNTNKLKVVLHKNFQGNNEAESKFNRLSKRIRHFEMISSHSTPKHTVPDYVNSLIGAIMHEEREIAKKFLAEIDNHISNEQNR